MLKSITASNKVKKQEEREKEVSSSVSFLVIKRLNCVFACLEISNKVSEFIDVEEGDS